MTAPRAAVSLYLWSTATGIRTPVSGGMVSVRANARVI
jgi:hypothetical protein